ncbi:MAG TPA: ergothioneine biosynthesis protein EgtB [Rhizomicrobium sp.]
MNIRLATPPSFAPAPANENPLAARYLAVRQQTENLAAPLSAEDQMLQSMPDASPTKWHRAHTTWFFETFLLGGEASYRPFHEKFGFLFNSYYEALGPRHARPQRGLLSRPSCAEIADYRAYVDEAMLAMIARGLSPQQEALLELGLNHEEQHQELLLTDILHALAQNALCPAYQTLRLAPAREASPLRFIPFDGGTITIGHDGDGFAFDNEGPSHQVILAPYALADRLTTNREWLAFMEAGGYRDATLWLSDGWALACAENWDAPLYWRERDSQWFSMTLAGEQPVDLNAPVTHVSFYEADAFARFMGKRLPTEAEWEHAARAQDIRGNLRESGYLRPIACEESSGRPRQMFGDVWEWTQSPYMAYPGYAPQDGALGEYNGKFMVNQMVLRGGSCVTPAAHMRATYRNFFHPHQRWQFSGVRLAESLMRRGAAKPDNEFLRDVLRGLSEPQKRLDAKYFYDEAGSKLFDDICRLPEYYPTRTEIALLNAIAPALGSRVAKGTALVEFGAGTGSKARQLLDAIAHLSAYVPVDICEPQLRQTVAAFKAHYPRLKVEAVIADITRRTQLPVGSAPLGFFPGSTIGNFTEDEAIEFLRAARATLGTNAQLLVGIDLVKDMETLIRAYDDSAGVTAAFNKNLLARINRELGGTFDPDGFAHRAIWNAGKSRIEMHVESLHEQSVFVAGRAFHFRRGETIHTENSHKYTLAGFAALAEKAGWRVAEHWTSDDSAFAEVLLF